MEASQQVKTEMVVYSVGVHMNTDSSYTPTISPEKTWPTIRQFLGKGSFNLHREKSGLVLTIQVFSIQS